MVDRTESVGTDLLQLGIACDEGHAINGNALRFKDQQGP
jgi:hypothetical protein